METAAHDHNWRLGSWSGDAHGMSVEVSCGWPTPDGDVKHGCGERRRVRVNASQLASLTNAIP